MKNSIIIGLVIAGCALYSCGGGNSSSENENNSAPISNAGSQPETMENNTTASIDINAYSSSKGVGKFKDVKIGKTIDPKLAAKGKELFQTSCTACHDLTTQKLVGPGLKGITKIRTPEWIMNQITNPEAMTHQDPVAEALLQAYNNVQMTNQNVGDDGARAILEFLRQNDATK